MKRLLLLFFAVMTIAFAQAATRTVYALRAERIGVRSDSESLYPRLMEISRNGAEIYYYNESYVLMNQPSEGLKAEFGADILPLEYPAAEQLYLVSRIPAMHERNLDRLKVVLDLGTSLLISTSHDELWLTQTISNPFTRLELKPMKFSAVTSISENYRETRTTIEQLIAQVNADSVQHFIQSMQNMQTRYALADNRLAVATWIKNQFVRMGLTNARLIPFQWNNTTQYNVEATLTGTVAPNEYVVVGGHHDSILSSGDATIFAPGADDNASGSVASLEMARVMMQMGYQPKCSIRFLTFAAEEFGLWGAKDYATTADNQNMQIRVMMNHDMIAYSTQSPSEWLVRLMPYDGSLEQSMFASQMTTDYTSLTPVYGSFNSGSSDSHPFWQHGFKVIYFFEHTFTPNYHSVNDLVINLNPEYCAEIIRASIACAVGFANMPAAPSGIAVHDVGNGTQLRVNWSAPPQTQIDHYNLYVGPSLEEMGEPISVTGTEYTLSGLTEGFLYCVQVSTVDTSGNESYRPWVSGTPRSVPVVPTGFAELPQSSSIRISWDANTELDLSGYQLYRSMNPDDQGTAVTGQNYTQTSYVDNDVTGSAGYYYYRLLAYDQDGNVSPFTETISSRPLSRDQGVLIIDETKNLSGTSPFQPNDVQADSFYSGLMTNWRTTQFDTEADPAYLRLADIGVYSSILWHGNDTSEMSYPYYVRDALRSYINAGGNVLFSVYQPSQAFELSATYPVNFGANSFSTTVLGITGADHSINARFRYAHSQVQGFPEMTVDSLKTTAAFNNHIIRVEGLYPSASATDIYTYGSDYASNTPQGSLSGLSVGILYQGTGGKVITLSFPLYNMREADSQALLTHVFGDLFNESVANDDPENILPVEVYLHRAYPNPFSAQTRFALKMDKPGENISIKVYNLKGQMVRSIYEGTVLQKDSEYLWDGKDAGGNRVGTGVYFLKASTKSAVSVIKVLKVE